MTAELKRASASVPAELRRDKLVDRLAEIQARADKATPAPWTTEKPPKDAEGWARGVLVAATPPRQCVYANPPGGSFPAADQDFIAHAREDIAFLLSVVKCLAAAPETLEVVEAATAAILDLMEAEGKTAYSGEFPRERYRDGIGRYARAALAAGMKKVMEP